MAKREVFVCLTLPSSGGRMGVIQVSDTPESGFRRWPIELRPDQPNNGELILLVYRVFDPNMKLPFYTFVRHVTNGRSNLSSETCYLPGDVDPRAGPCINFGRSGTERYHRQGGFAHYAKVPITSAL